MSSPLPAPVLEGRHVRLEPLSIEHVDALVAAAGEDRSTYRYTEVPETRDAMSSYVADLLAQVERGETVPFAQRGQRDGRVVGATRFLTIRRWDDGAPFAVEIGGTWLAASAQRGAINSEAKLLLLTHAFETWRVARVDLKTDARNERSASAIARLGATFEGILRQWQPSLVEGEQGLLRDSAIYSILAPEWPSVRDALATRRSR